MGFCVTRYALKVLYVIRFVHQSINFLHDTRNDKKRSNESSTLLQYHCRFQYCGAVIFQYAEAAL